MRFWKKKQAQQVTKKVALYDYDGDITISSVDAYGYAHRIGKRVRLNADGSCTGPSYVERWEPLPLVVDRLEVEPDLLKRIEYLENTVQQLERDHHEKA